MQGIFDVATRVSTPLMLAGFISAAFFLIARQVIKANLFPKLTRQMSADILQLIIRRLFQLAITAMILGFVGFLVTSLLIREDASRTSEASTLRSLGNTAPLTDEPSSLDIAFEQIKLDTDKCLWEPIKENWNVKEYTGDMPPVKIHGPIQDVYPLGSHQVFPPLTTQDVAFEDDDTTGSPIGVSSARIADPVFDITITNRSKESVVINRIGILPIAYWEQSKGVATAAKIQTLAEYQLPAGELTPGRAIEEPINPIVVPPDAPFRFQLQLQNYAHDIDGNETVIQIFVGVRDRKMCTRDIYLGVYSRDEETDGLTYEGLDRAATEGERPERERESPREDGRQWRGPATI